MTHRVNSVMHGNGRGPCCLVRRCLFTPTWKESIWQGLTVQPQRITHVKPQDHSFLSLVVDNVKSVELLRPRKVSTPDACGNSPKFGSSQRHESNGYCRQWCVTRHSTPDCSLQLQSSQASQFATCCRGN